MGSEKNDGTSVPLAEPKLCANGCGFFGTAANMNLCSKCYRDYLLNEEQVASAKAAMEKTLSIKNIVTKQEEAVVEVAGKVEVVVGDNGSSASKTMAVEAGGGGEVKLGNKCCSCKKKVGVMGFKCKCGSVFCGAHRYPENHGCEFDFKGAGREAIAKANPTVKTDKVDRF